MIPCGSPRRRFLGLLLVLILWSWSPSGGETKAKSGPAAEPRGAAQRIVALAPNVVELLFELGLGDRVVGVGNYCRFPPEVAELPQLGGLVDPHLESIVALRPDLVITLASEEKLAGHVERLGIPVLRLEIETLDQVVDAARSIGQATGMAEVGEVFAQDFSQHMAAHTPAASPSVLIVFGRQPGHLGELMTAGAETYLSELLSLLGAENTFADAAGRYPRIGMEEILRRDPDWIIELQWAPLDPTSEGSLVADWQAFGTLQAVRQGRIGVIAGEHTVIPGPRLRQLYDELSDLLLASP